MPVHADSPLPITLVTSFDQRSPHRFSVTIALSASETRRQISLTRSVTRPCTSPVRNTVCFVPLLPAARRTWPGSHRSTVIELAMQPTVLPQPTTPAIVSSFMQFCSETMKPPGARYWLISVVAHSVSYDFMQTKAMSIGFSLASCCASVTCIARTLVVNSGTSRMWLIFRPSRCIFSTCAGHGSMNVTSSPACAMCAPA